MIVQPDDWKRQPFGDVTSIPFKAIFSAGEFELIQAGHVPTDMDDRWFMYFSEPSLFIHRSWTGKAIFRVDFESAPDGTSVSQAVCNVGTLSDRDADYHAKLVEVLIGNVLLNRHMPFPDPIDDARQPEVKAEIRQPWWKFWAR